MSDTPNLNLPYMLAAQAQKHVTHNEALRMLDAVVQLSVLDRDLAAPPGSPAEGDRYIVAATPTGAWTGHATHIAAFQDGAWLFYPPVEGWLAWVADENALVVFDGAAWSSASSGGGGVTDHGLLTGLGDDDHPHYHNDARGDARYTPVAPSMLGINATADMTNRFAVAALASLFNHVGNGHQVKVNKNAAADTASFLFQTGFSGRAEFGTTGDDDFHFKVSPNGSTFYEALVIDRSSGKVTMPNTAPVTVQVFSATGTWTKPAGCTRVRVRAVGGGGGGAGATAAASASCAGGGGSSGSYSEGVFDVTATSSVSVTIGAAGTAGAAANGTGGTGGATSFGALLTAPGGLGGSGMSSGTAAAFALGGALPAAGTGGSIMAPGVGGHCSERASATVFIAGNGANGPFGGGQRGSTNAGSGGAGAAPGAGGSGAASSSATGFAGGAGAAGIVIVEEWY